MLWFLRSDFFDMACWLLLLLLLLLPSSHTALSESLTDDAPLGVDVLGSRVVLFTVTNTHRLVTIALPPPHPHPTPTPPRPVTHHNMTVLLLLLLLLCHIHSPE